MNVDRAGSVGRSHLAGAPVEQATATSALERREGAAAGDATAKMLASASPTTMIQALQIFARDLQRDASQGAILDKKQAVEDARRQVQEALERAQREANEKAGWSKLTGTLGTIAKVAAVTAAVASIALTGGVSAPLLIGLAGTLISATAKPLSQALGGGEKTQNALAYGGAALSLAAGGAGLFSSASSATGTAATVAHGTVAAANGTGGAATAASGYTGYRAGLHGSRETEARADETGLRAQQKQLVRQLDQLVEMLQEVEKSFTKSISAVQSARESEAAANLTLAAGMRA